MELLATRRDVDEAALLLKGVDPSREWVPNVRTGDTVIDVQTGEPVLIVRRYPGDLRALRHALISYPRQTVVRAGGQRNDANTFGFTPRRVMFKRNACRACAASIEAPELHRQIADVAGREVADLLLREYPERACHDAEEAQAVLPEWRLHGSWFTSGVVNWNSALAYHYDRNNLDCWSAMAVVRRHVHGGHLHVPAYDAVVDCRDGDVIMFYGRGLLHGVTPMRKVRGDGYRISAVWYTVDGMRHCLPPEDEARRAREERTAREDTLIERQRAEGWIRE
jgi:hypothetical protein